MVWLALSINNKTKKILKNLPWEHLNFLAPA